LIRDRASRMSTGRFRKPPFHAGIRTEVTLTRSAELQNIGICAMGVGEWNRRCRMTPTKTV
jgi:hypothetical protein